MGFKAISTRRTSATSAVSNQATVINTGTGNLSVGGSAIQANTSITLGVTTPGQSSANSAVTASGGPTITSFVYLDANNNPTSANAVSTSGGNIRITGTGFAANPSVYINNSLVANTFVSSTQITAVCPAASAGNVGLFIFNTANVGALSNTPVRYSGAPSWSTSSVTFQNNVYANVALVASSDSALTFTLQAGSTLPTGISLQSAGYLVGTPTGYTTNTVISPVLIATDAEGQATQQTLTITVSAADPQFNYVSLLVNGDTGTNTSNAATNNTFIDSSSNNNAITRAGNTTQGTFSPFSQTGWSNYFDGTGDFLSVTGADIALGAGDFTIEFWVNGSYSGTKVLLDWAAAPQLYMSGTSIVWYWNADRITGTLVTNTWQHVAIVRASGVTKMYIDGTANATTFADSTSLAGTTLTFGGRAASTANTIDGYMSNLRLVKGTAVYTTNFTPSTTPLTAVSGTSLLTCKSNRFIDTSANAYAISVGAGRPIVQASSPFAPSAAYSASTNGGCAYFDGTGDGLLYSLNTTSYVGLTDFTVEAWFNRSAAPAANMTILHFGGTSGGFATATLTNVITTNLITAEISLNGTSTGLSITSTGTALPLGQWAHVALVRSGTAVTLYINGVSAASGTLSGAVTANGPYNTIGARTTDGSTFNRNMIGYVSGVRFTSSAIYTTAFTPPTAPPTAVANTNFLANFTNGGIVDAHSTNLLETVGTTQLNTTVKQFGTASVYFGGNGDYCVSPSSQMYAFGTGDFTLEAWIYRTDTGVQRAIIDTRGGATVGALFYITTNNKLNIFDSSTTWITSTNTVPANQWVHVAAARASGTTKLFINGNQEASAADARTYVNLTAGLYIGRQYGSTTNDFLGYMDDVRITKGFARYTANFTAPTSTFQGQ